MTKNPYNIIKHQYVTEKTNVLLSLKDNKKNPCIARFESPKYVFVVDGQANKHEIAAAIEEIYKDKQVKVTSVNTLHVKSKPRRKNGRYGKTAAFKKAIVTLHPNDSLETV